MLERSESIGAVRTVKLARGHTTDSARPTPFCLRRNSSAEEAHTPSNQEPHNLNAAALLTQIGILELLQQDERPTFIIDIADPANFQPSCLCLLFANAALRSRPALLDHVRGVFDDPRSNPTGVTAFKRFKQWATSHVKDGEALTVSPPTYTYAGSVWTCSTLRKRLRVIASRLSHGHPVPDASPYVSDMQHYQGLVSLSKTLSESTKQGASDCCDESTCAGLLRSPIDRGDPTCQDSPQVVSTRKSASSAAKASGVTNGDIESMELLLSPRPQEVEERSRDGLNRSGSNGQNAIPDHGFFDWTRLPESATMPPHIRFARSVNWAATSLGSMETWDADLRAMCNLIMASPHPAAMYYGPDLVAIYNEAYILLAGNKHPVLMGQKYRDAYSEIWDAVKDVFITALSTAQATMKDDDQLFMNRDGFLEETYFSWSVIPLIGADGSVVGLYNPAFEKTRRKIAERRMLTLREIGERTAAAREVSKFWPLLLQGLEYNELDAPFVLLYSVAEDWDSDSSSVHSSSAVTEKTLILEGSLGVPTGHKSAPRQIDLKRCTQGFAPVFRSAVTTDKPIILSEKNGTLDTELLKGIEWRGYGDPSSTVVICPIHPTTGESTLGFLVMGTNPRRPFDQDYELYVQLLARQLATSIASVVLFEEEIRRGEQAARLAAQDRIELANQLAARTQEAVESEIKFTRMAELAPVGMFIADSSGRLNYCNDTWYDLSSYPKGDLVGEDWIDYVGDEDRPLVTGQWQKIIDDKIPISVEFRFKKPWQDRDGNRFTNTWVLTSAYPEKGPDGALKRIFGSVTDISTQKFAEELQKRRMEEAVELKRQQENFIDITSHEMRNPLSAILQCADEISSSLTEARFNPSLASESLDSNIDAAQTITLCAQHQKRIVDDVLTVSKLDSARLLVTPVDVQPKSVVQRALKMFEGELQTADISLDFRIDESVHTLGVNWVRLDPSRLLQVLINLTTNAIKFTTAQERRSIIVRMGASLQRPSEQPEKTVDYVPSRSKGKDDMSSPEWGTGEDVFLTFAIRDTGRGLTESEKKLLFLRFSQASPRTHVTYGGSGLGLFISRELVELQGGEIGVSSESGRGSTFAFYIKARHSPAPPQDAEAPLNTPQIQKSSGPKTQSQSAVDVRAPVPTPQPLIPNDAPRSTNPNDAQPSALRVLVVEDNLVNQKVLAKQLQKMGCVVHVANHGGEAIDRLRSSRFWKGKETSGMELDIILMDVEMPVMDGLTCTRKIRELQLSKSLVKHVPVIAVTANAREEQIATTREAGVDDVMSKPFRILDLLPKMRALANGSYQSPWPNSPALLRSLSS